MTDTTRRLPETIFVAGMRFILLILLLAHSYTALAAWTTRDPEELGRGRVAYTANEAGQRAEIYLGERDIVYLQFVLGEGFETFAISNCPTFQIDKRKPMHHFNVGNRCAVVAKRATIMLGQITDQEIESLILHRFLNGNRVTFRYTVNSGQYRQAIFSLRSSKQALMQALGFDTRIRVD